jgi:Chaperone of endosialidase
MKKYCLLLIIFLGSIATFAQSVGINTDGSTPHSSAMLDIKSTTKGLLIPRMTQAQRNAIAGPANGLFIYQTDGTPGFYYYNGSAWTAISAGASGNFWNTTGNAGTDSTNNFIGTTDQEPLIGKVNGQQVFKFSTNVKSTIVGLNAGKVNAADSNTFIGNEAGYSNTTGFENYFGGYKAGYNNTTGNYNHFTGYKAGYSNTTKSRNQFEGYAAGYSNTSGADNLYVGFMAGNSSTAGDANVFVGAEAGRNNTQGSDNLFLGHLAGYMNTTGSNSHFIGYAAGYNNSTGYHNHFDGYEAGYANTSGSWNQFVGYQAGNNNTTGSDNLFFGFQSGYGNTTGNQNIFIGRQAGENNSIGLENHFVGFESGSSNTTGNYNQFEGYRAGYNNSTGNRNQFNGFESGFNHVNGDYNTLIGFRAGYNNDAGYNNTMLGYQAGYSNISGGGNVFLGTNAGYYETGSDKLYIDNSSTTTPLIYGDFATNLFRTNGNVEHTRGSFNSSIPLLFLKEKGSNYVKLRLGNDANTHYWDAAAIPGDASDYNAHFSFYYTNSFSTHQIFSIQGDGNAFLTGTLFESSDQRLKKNIQRFDNVLPKLNNLNAYTYNWIDSSKSKAQQVGLIAQEIEKEFPQLVNTDEKGIKSVAYANMVPVLLQAIKEQQKEIEELKRLITEKK